MSTFPLFPRSSLFFGFDYVSGFLLHLTPYMHLWAWSGSVSGYARRSLKDSLAILSIFCFVYRTSIDFYIRR